MNAKVVEFEHRINRVRRRLFQPNQKPKKHNKYRQDIPEGVFIKQDNIKFNLQVFPFSLNKSFPDRKPSH